MTIVSDDPTWWPFINESRNFSYFMVAAFVGLIYDWALTFGEEVELIWARYLGILSTAMYILGLVSYMVWNWTVPVVFAMLRVIIIARLYAMYQRSRMILIFLIVTFLAVSILDGVTTIMTTMRVSGEEFILSGTYLCLIGYSESDIILLVPATSILSIAWEVVALCLAVWISVQHFRELRQHSAGDIRKDDCFTVLMKSHVVHFASFVAGSCFTLILDFTPTLSTANSLEAQMFEGFFQILQVVQISVLGPRLILGVREYYAKLVAVADAATDMNSIAFQERVHISTGSGV
ncbi:hypothetical protein BDR06DRAFT_1025106 [Suillus hirtellus]|nr:hypothetical protein BDR06DRAFT_1025106 [Suillus hirtellus]